jgi:putative peptidoglycan lipid II flippase
MVKNIFTLLTTKQNSILSGAFVLMVTVFATKFLGLVRDRLLVHQFDTSQVSIFFAAFRLPDLMFQLLIFGALSVAFIPVFTEQLNERGEKEAFTFASNILNISFALFAVLLIVAFIFVDFFNGIFVPGFAGQQKILTNHLTQTILLGQLILVIGAFFIGIAQSYQRFIIPALAPLMYNVGIIIGIIFLTPSLGVLGPALGVVIGAALHVLIQLPLINSLGFRYKFTFDIFNSGVREVIRMISIRNVGLAIEQINETVSVALASLISYSSVTFLTFAQHLQVVPIGLFGATIAQAALPVLSVNKSKGQLPQFKEVLLTTLHQILFLTLPAAAILIVLRIPIVRLTFGASQFSWTDTVLTAQTLAWFSGGLAAQSAILLLVRGFYALKDTRTPVYASIITVTVNIVSSFIFIRWLHLDVWSLGLAYTLSSNIGFIFLLFFLYKKVDGFDLHKLLMPAFKMVLAATFAAIALYIPIKALDQLVFDTTRTFNLLLLTGIASIFGLSVYGFLVWCFKVRELQTFRDLVMKLYKRKTKMDTPEITEETTRPL